jgi:hypothetical protein
VDGLAWGAAITKGRERMRESNIEEVAKKEGDILGSPPLCQPDSTTRTAVEKYTVYLARLNPWQGINDDMLSREQCSKPCEPCELQIPQSAIVYNVYNLISAFAIMAQVKTTSTDQD